MDEQPSESERYGDLEGGLSMYGVVKRKRDNDMELHSNKQVCGAEGRGRERRFGGMRRVRGMVREGKGIVSRGNREG